MHYSVLLLAALILISCAGNTPEKVNQAEDPMVCGAFIGTYTRKEGHVDGKAAGIYYTSMNEDGSVVVERTAAEITNPSFVAWSPSGDDLYAVSEIGGEDSDRGSLVRYAVVAGNSLSKVTSIETGGMYPCHVTVDISGDYVFVANYVGGVDMYSTRHADGLKLTDHVDFEGGTDHPRQDASHTHMTCLGPDGRFLYVMDLGSNRIWSFEVDRVNGLLRPNSLQEFYVASKHAGPRHMALHPAQDLAYVINELNNTVSVLEVNRSTGTLTLKQEISTLPEDYQGANTTADIHVHPSGNFLYGSNRGHNSIVIFKVAPDGTLVLQGHVDTRGRTPRNFAISPGGKFLHVANQDSDSITSFAIDTATGALNFFHQTAVKTPVCIAFCPGGTEG